MSDWKNPSFGRRDNTDDWKPPFLDDPFATDDDDTRERVSVSLFIRALFGFLIIVSINAVALFGVSYFAGYDLSYRNAVIIAGIYILWRVYDMKTMGRLNK